MNFVLKFQYDMQCHSMYTSYYKAKVNSKKWRGKKTHFATWEHRLLSDSRDQDPSGLASAPFLF